MSGVFDIAFVGGGIAALSAAYFLKGRRSVIILESEEALGYHATGRSAAEFAFRFHTPLAGRLAALSFPFLDQPPDGFCDGPLLAPRGILLVAYAEKQARLAEVQASEGSALESLTPEQALGRAPNQVELAMFSLLWSEHCAYKHSKKRLRTLPTEGPSVVMGPGENAGAVDVGDGLTIAFKVASHNHPRACLLYTSPRPPDRTRTRLPSSA